MAAFVRAVWGYDTAATSTCLLERLTGYAIIEADLSDTVASAGYAYQDHQALPRNGVRSCHLYRWQRRIRPVR